VVVDVPLVAMPLVAMLTLYVFVECVGVRKGRMIVRVGMCSNEMVNGPVLSAGIVVSDVDVIVIVDHLLMSVFIEVLCHDRTAISREYEGCGRAPTA